jgi:hypothetical protein
MVLKKKATSGIENIDADFSLSLSLSISLCQHDWSFSF